YIHPKLGPSREGTFCRAYTPPALRFDTTFHCALILLFSSYESSGHWWWRARACVGVEAAAVAAGAGDVLRAGEWRHQPGRGVHSSRPKEFGIAGRAGQSVAA